MEKVKHEENSQNYTFITYDFEKNQHVQFFWCMASSFYLRSFTPNQGPNGFRMHFVENQIVEV